MTKLFRFNIYNRISFSTQADLYAFTIQMVSDQQLGEVAFDDVYLYKADNAYVAAVDDAATESICKCEGCEYPFCTCACETEESCTCVSCDMKTTSTNDAHGNIVSIEAFEGEYFFNFVYDAFGNVMLDISGAAIDRIQQNINNADCLVEKLIYAIGGALGVAAVTGITFACVPNAYKGYIYDLETGLYYCQSRYYSPAWGRFINADDTLLLELTTGAIHGANLFAYCNNDPVNHVDPTGLLGRHWYNKVSNVAKAIDIAIIAITAGKSLVGIKAIRAFLKANRRKLVQNVTKQLTKMIGSYAATFLPAAIDAALTLFGTSIGDLIARGLDYVDPYWGRGYRRNNGYILN